MKTNQHKFRAGFTLVELIVVIGLMGLLSTISIGGYFAATRGMTARGAVQDTASIMRQAMQTALIDQVPTAVIFLNRRTNQKSKGGGVHGRAIAIKMGGRISYVARNGCRATNGNTVPGGAMLIDEFADWNQSYSLTSNNNGDQVGFRFYRIFSVESGYISSGLGGGLDTISSVMCNWVGYRDFEQDYMIETGMTIGDWCADNNREGQANDNFSGVGYKNANSYRWGLPFHPGNKGLNANQWKRGDAYGIEIAQLDLPGSYIFGTKVPDDTEFKPASGGGTKDIVVFLPGKIQAANQYKFPSVGKVVVSVVNDLTSSDSAVIGEVDNDLLEDKN